MADGTIDARKNASKNNDGAQSPTEQVPFFAKPVNIIVFMVFPALFFILISNIATGFLTFLITRKQIEQSYLHQDGLFPEGKYRGPLLHIPEKLYLLHEVEKSNALNLELYLQLDNQNSAREVWEKSARIRHIINEIISSYSAEDFFSQSGIQRARRNMLEEINKILDESRIIDAYFTKLCIVHNSNNHT